MGQIIGSAAKPKRCNLNQLSQLGTPAAGEHILVSSDNSMNAAGQGYFDSYIIGDGTTAATALELYKYKAEELDEQINGKTIEASFELPVPFLSANYSGGSGSRVIKYENGAILYQCTGTNKTSIQYMFTASAVTDLTTNSADWVSVDLNTDDPLQLKYSATNNCGSNITGEKIVIWYKKGDFSNSAIALNIPISKGVTTDEIIDLKSLLIAAAPTSWQTITYVTIQGIASDTASTGDTIDINVSVYGFNTIAPTTTKGLADDVEDLKDDVEILGGKVSEIENITEGMVTTTDVISLATIGSNQYIRYSDGATITAGSSAQMTTYTIPTSELGDKIIVTAASSDTVPAVVAFYSGVVNKLNYMQEESVQAEVSAGKEYVVDIPASAMYVVVTNRGAYLATPQISTQTFNIGKTTDRLSSLETQIKHKSVALFDFTLSPYIAHYAVNDFLKYGDGTNAIPSESIADVEAMARLGHTFIEANIHKTSDGHYVCIHGNDSANGKVFGDEVEDAYQNLVIGDTTLAYIQANIRYKSAVAKYQTTIPTLEEFCEACKRNNIGIVAGVGLDEDAAKICIKYLGESGVIFYSAPAKVREYFGGWMDIYTNSSSVTIEECLAVANTYKPPFISFVGPSAIIKLKNDGLLGTFIETMHNNGYLCGVAAIYQTEEECRELMEMGFDVFSAGHEVNPFAHNFEHYDIADASELQNISTTGTKANGTITLSANQEVNCGSTDAIALGKGELRIKFSGTLAIYFGSKGGRVVTSDGSKTIVITDYFLQKNTALRLLAQTSATITEMVYKTSKC